MDDYVADGQKATSAAGQSYKPTAFDPPNMATASTAEKGFGLSILFVVVALLGALVMFMSAQEQLIAATGFAIAVIAGSLAIAARHVLG